MKYIYNCKTEEETKKLAAALSQITGKGDVWALFGTLGMGKSVFARAFIKALTGATEVPSPTFTLVQTYSAPDFDIFHYDLYRLKSPEEIWELNIEEAMYNNVCLIEWPEKMGAYLPRNVFRINIKQDENNGRLVEIIVGAEDKIRRIARCGRKPDEQSAN